MSPQIGRQHREALDGGPACLLDRGPEGVHGCASLPVVAQRAVDQGAQVQGVGAVLHEGGAVRGVLDTVGEDEGLLLLGSDVGAAEELPERG